jgi:hypothetical protein
MAISQSAGTPQSSPLTGVATGNTLLYSGTVYRGDGSWVRQQRTALGVEANMTNSIPNPPAGGFPKYLRLRRVGNVFQAAVSDNGTTWSESDNTGNATVVLGNAYVGLIVSGNADNVGEVDFTEMYFGSGTNMGAATVTTQTAGMNKIDFRWLQQ